MAVEFVLNGYFRSGTSALWDIIRSDIPDLEFFYEPCHPKLLWFVDEYARRGGVNKLHGLELWGNYLSYEDVLERLLDIKAEVSGRFSSNSSVKSTFEVFDRLESPVALQTNRWHSSLGWMVEDYGVEVIHVVRNPFDVYRSMRRVYFSSGDFLTRSIKCALAPFLGGEVFEMREQLNYLKNSKWSLINSHRKLKDLQFYFSGFEKFIYCWLVFNSLAIKSIFRRGGQIVFYENVLAEGKGLRVKGKVVNLDGFKPGRFCFIEDEERERLSRIAKKIGLSKELDIILDHSKS